MEYRAIPRFKLVLIGPRGVGKSSLADCISQRLRLPLFELDAECWSLYMQDERFRAAAADVDASDPLLALRQVLTALWRELAQEFPAYQEQLQLGALRTGLASTRAPIVDCGSGHCSFRSDRNQAELADLLAPLPVLCLWPSRDFKRGVELLASRNGRSREETAEALRFHRGRSLARHVIMVEDRSISDVADEAVAWMSMPAVQVEE